MSGNPNSGNIPAPDLNAWLLSTLADFASLVNCISHGTIQAFDATTQTATVAINYLRVIKGANPNLPNPSPDDQTSDVFMSYPLLVKVPIIVLRGGGGSLTFPIAATTYNEDGSVKKLGDACLLFFNDREIDTWFTTGQITAPQNLRTHDLTDAWALVGIANMLNAIVDYSTTSLQLTYKGAQLTFDQNSNATLIDQKGEKLPFTLDMKPSLQTTNHSGWLLMNGQTIGPAGSGADNTGPQYQDLYTGLGGTWSSNTPLAIPDIRGYTVAGYLASDPNFGTLKAKIGESTHLLTGPESGIQAHSHTYYNPNTHDSTSGSPETAGGRNPFSDNTETTGPTNAQNPHNNIQQTFVANWFIKI